MLRSIAWDVDLLRKVKAVVQLYAPAVWSCTLRAIQPQLSNCLLALCHQVIVVLMLRINKMAMLLHKEKGKGGEELNVVSLETWDTAWQMHSVVFAILCDELNKSFSLRHQ